MLVRHIGKLYPVRRLESTTRNQSELVYYTRVATIQDGVTVGTESITIFNTGNTDFFPHKLLLFFKETGKVIVVVAVVVVLDLSTHYQWPVARFQIMCWCVLVIK